GYPTCCSCWQECWPGMSAARRCSGVTTGIVRLRRLRTFPALAAAVCTQNGPPPLPVEVGAGIGLASARDVAVTYNVIARQGLILTEQCLDQRPELFVVRAGIRRAVRPLELDANREVVARRPAAIM